MSLLLCSHHSNARDGYKSWVTVKQPYTLMCFPDLQLSQINLSSG
jgi:hypothetical protein